MKPTAVPTDLNVNDVAALLNPLRKMGKKLVTTNGCFDLLHRGHIEYLNDAAKLGDLLVVGINSDSSVKRLKGPSRPIQNETDRLFQIASLKCVDYAFVFFEADPCAFLEILRPDIHVKGGDYTPEKLPETKIVEKYGGRISIVSFVKGYSTSGLIEAVRLK
jgi:glycerol-3-phosphate cytidylyltransferase